MLAAFSSCSADSQMMCMHVDTFHQLLCTTAVSCFFLSEGEVEKITAVLLKSHSGEFDLESILFLKFRGLGKVRLTYLFPCNHMLTCD